MFIVVGAPAAWRAYTVWWLFSSARHEIARGNADAAVGHLRQLEQIKPNRADVQYRLAVALRRSGTVDDVEQHLVRAADLGWPISDIERQRELLRIQIGLTENARQAVNEFLSQDVSDEVAEEVYEALTRGYLTAFQLPEAAETIRHWLQWRPDSTQARLWMAEVHQKVDRTDDAMKEYRAVLEYDPSRVDARKHLASLLLKVTRVDEAYQEYQRCLELDPDDASTILGLAECELRLGQTEQAKARLEAAAGLDLTPVQRAGCLRELGNLALQEERVEDARKMLEEATRLSPLDSSAWYNLGLALVRSGEAEKGQEMMERSSAISKQFNELIDASVTLIQQPNNVPLRRKIGLGMMELGLEQEGAGWLRTALVIDPTDAESNLRLAEYYESKGNQQQAAFHRRMASRASVEAPPPADGDRSAHDGPNQPAEAAADGTTPSGGSKPDDLSHPGDTANPIPGVSVGDNQPSDSSPAPVP